LEERAVAPSLSHDVEADAVDFLRPREQRLRRRRVRDGLE